MAIIHLLLPNLVIVPSFLGEVQTAWHELELEREREREREHADSMETESTKQCFETNLEPSLSPSRRPLNSHESISGMVDPKEL